MDIGFVGLGQMGLPMAVHLSRAGHDVLGFDIALSRRDALSDAGVPAAGALAELSHHADVVFLSLPDAAVVEQTLFGDGGLLAGDPAARWVVDLSTIGPRAANDLSARAIQKGVGWIEAPVSGGPPAANAAKLAIMLACHADVRELAERMLQSIGRPIWVGERAGFAQAAKLANNMLSTIAMIATSEVMVMAVKEGLDPGTLLDVINSGSGRNSATLDKFPREVLTRKFSYGFQTLLALKDTNLCLETAETLGVPMHLASHVRLILGAVEQKHGPLSDFSEIVKLYEESAGVLVGAGGST